MPFPSVTDQPPTPRALLCSLIRQLSAVQVEGTTSRGRRNIEAEHISDSEASSPSSSASSLAAGASPSAPTLATGSGPRTGPSDGISNPLTPLLAHPHTKPLLTTLHGLLPHHLLPALDVLDRRLVTRLRSGPARDERADSREAERVVYYVRSVTSGGAAGAGSTTAAATATTGIHGLLGQEETDAGPEGYEVRLRPWHCSCAAFAFAAAEGEAGAAESATGEANEARAARVAPSAQLFGGLYRAEAPPVCKHLLACLLAEQWLPLRANVLERNVSAEEMAGWAASWV